MAGKKQRARQIRVLMSYDLGKDQKKFNQMYGWLNGLSATECGNSTAFFYYSKGSRKYLVSSIKRELTELFDDLNNVRIFIAYTGDKNVYKTSWLFGKPKIDAPWSNAMPIYI